MGKGTTFSMDLGWQALLTDLDVNSAHVLRRASLPDDTLQRPGQGLTTAEYFRFWAALEAEAADPLFALRIVDAISVESFSPPLFAALCSVNLLQAVKRLATYKQLVAPMRLEATQNDGALTVAPHWISAETVAPHSLQVTELAFFLKLARMATRAPIQALQLCLPVSPYLPQAKRYEQYFGAVLRSHAGPSITFRGEDARLPFLTLNEGMWRIFEPDLRRRLSELDATADTSERVRAALLELLPGNAATIGNAAERLGMSKRTLQRRLEDEGRSFRSLVNATRADLARHYLSHATMSGNEIAFLLGFEDPSSFYRAFHEWTGQTPDSLRSRPLSVKH